MPRIHCLRHEIVSGGTTYPIFMGFLPAEEIATIAAAPAFSETTDHATIAGNLLQTPMKDWQRPINPERVAGIRDFFSNTGEIMPNPVLLAESGMRGAARIRVSRETGANNVQLNTWLLEIPDAAGEEEKSLWIIDGQHRIFGLATSAQRGNPVPLVVLLNEGAHSYTPETLAKLFAQVTTAAERLSELHNEWLTYAFRLREYAAGAEQEEHLRSMEAAVHLCRIQTLPGSRSANPFLNCVRFNPFPEGGTVRPRGGGFAYDCIELKQLIHAEYYHRLEQRPPLAPAEVAEQLAEAYLALQRCVAGDQSHTVFFGESDSGGHKAMQDGFFAGVLGHLVVHGIPDSWDNILRRLHFHATPWDFRDWVDSMEGAAGNTSRKIAMAVLRETLSEGQLPEGNPNLSDYLQGNTAHLIIHARNVTADGRAIPTGKHDIRVEPGARSHSIGARRQLKVGYQSSNIGKVVVLDEAAPLKTVFAIEALRRGVILKDDAMENPTRLQIRMDTYGGNYLEAKVTIRWDPAPP